MWARRFIELIGVTRERRVSRTYAFGAIVIAIFPAGAHPLGPSRRYRGLLDQASRQRTPSVHPAPADPAHHGSPARLPITPAELFHTT